MKDCPVTGLTALNRGEVERRNPFGEPEHFADWQRWPELHGYIVRAARTGRSSTPAALRGERAAGDERAGCRLAVLHGVSAVLPRARCPVADIIGLEQRGWGLSAPAPPARGPQDSARHPALHGNRRLWPAA